MQEDRTPDTKPTKKLVVVNTAKIIRDLETRVRELEEHSNVTELKQRISELEAALSQANHLTHSKVPSNYSRMTNRAALFFQSYGKLTAYICYKSSKIEKELSESIITQFFDSIRVRDFVLLSTLLHDHPNLAHTVHSVFDSSGIELSRITGLQYALCLRDSQIWSVIIASLNELDLNLQILAYVTERHDLLKLPCVFDTLRTLIDKLSVFAESFHQWDYATANNHWIDSVSKAEISLPAWIIYPMMEEGMDAPWITKEFTKPTPYNPKYLETWPGDDNYQLGNLNLKHAFAWCRGKNPCPAKNLAYCFGFATGLAVEHDIQCITSLLQMAELAYNQLIASFPIQDASKILELLENRETHINSLELNSIQSKIPSEDILRGILQQFKTDQNTPNLSNE